MRECVKPETVISKGKLFIDFCSRTVHEHLHLCMANAVCKPVPVGFV